MDKDISPVRVTCSIRTDGRTVWTCNECYVTLSPCDAPYRAFLTIIPVIADRHYGLKKNTPHTISLPLTQTAVIDKVHIMFFTLPSDVLTRLQTTAVKGQAASFRWQMEEHKVAGPLCKLASLVNALVCTWLTQDIGHVAFLLALW